MRAFLKFLFFLFALETLVFGASSKLLNIIIQDSSVVLEFNSPITAKDIKQNTLENQSDKSKYRQFFDIEAALIAKPVAKKDGKFFDELKLSQFDPQHIRLVALIKKDEKLTAKIDGKKVIFVPNVKVHNEKIQELPQSKEPQVSAKDILRDVNLELERQPVAKKEDRVESFGAATVAPWSKKKLIVIDPGHGGKDPGAIGISSRQEKDVVFTLAVVTKELLEKKGYQVLLTRDGDYFVELQDRTRFSNHKSADLFLSIHANAVDFRHSDPGKSKGIETFFLSPARSDRAKRVAQIENGPSMDVMDSFSKEAFLTVLNREKIVASNKLAIDVHRSVLGNLRAKYKDATDGGVREAPFWVLVGAQMPAILVEIGYITNPDEAQRFEDPMFRALFARGLVDGVEKYFENN